MVSGPASGAHKRPSPSLLAGLAILGVFVTVALLAPWLAPYDPRLPSGEPLRSPANGHLLGTNDLGQDVLSQLIYGTRPTLLVAAGVTIVSTAMSWLVGLAAAAGRLPETPLMAVTDLLLALPSLPLLLLVLTLVDSNRLTLILALGFLSWPAYARVVRSIAVQTRTAPYLDAARALGATTPHLARYHLLPATLVVLPAKLVLTTRFAVFAEATLAFLGLGSSGTASWGTMLSWAFADPLLFARPVWPWLVLPPTLAIALLVLATVWVGDAAERLAQPRSIGRYRTSTSTRFTTSGTAPSTAEESVSPHPKSAPTTP